MNTEIVLTIHYIDDTILKFKWDEINEDPSTMVAKVRKALEMDRIYIECDGDLIIVLTQHIRYASLSPSPSALPKDMVIRNATIFGWPKSVKKLHSRYSSEASSS
jgi:hypothetical protein